MTQEDAAERKFDPSIPVVVQLSDRQLAAYNHADIDTFCECYADDVVVLDANGREINRGIDRFRSSYEKLFSEFLDVKAEALGRLVCDPHSIELEHWNRVRRKDGKKLSGEVLVRYTERDGKIAVVQFFGP